MEKVRDRASELEGQRERERRAEEKLKEEQMNEKELRWKREAEMQLERKKQREVEMQRRMQKTREENMLQRGERVPRLRFQGWLCGCGAKVKQPLAQVPARYSLPGESVLDLFFNNFSAYADGEHRGLDRIRG